ncbi:MAG: hypothetical protein RDV48_02830 [Candidatus Eremiobacteraeota bacterium]|nr:hypothetical protein [Candidatus Eremiobacteraeota bacterium]
MKNRKALHESSPEDEGASRLTRWVRHHGKLSAFIKELLKAMAPLGATLYLAGGTVRDVLEGKSDLKDIDLMITGLQSPSLEKILRDLKRRAALQVKEVISAGKHFPVFKVAVRWALNPVDVALARKEQSTGSGHRDFAISTQNVTARQDSSRRDFTINALFFKFTLKGRTVGGTIVDYQQGLKGLARKEIKAVGNPYERFAEDPLRMLRAIRQKNQRRGFTIEKKTWAAIEKSMPALIHTISMERIAEELIKSLHANPVETYHDWKKSGALRELIPELASMAGEREKIFVRRFLYLPSFSATHEITATLLLACLLCDTALEECSDLMAGHGEKPVPGGTHPGDPAFYTAKRQAIVARRLALPNLRDIENLLRWFLCLVNYERLEERRAVAEEILAGNPMARQLITLYNAHQKAVVREKRDFDYLLDKCALTPRLIKGNDLVAAGIPRGPHLSLILRSIREQELCDRLTSKDDALCCALVLYRQCHETTQGGAP